MTDPKVVNYVKFNLILIDERQQHYSQPKRELCSLKMVLDKENYLLYGCRNLIIETNARYLFGMLNNPGRLPNTTINHWISEIRHYQFTLVYKEEKTFGLDGLSRRKGYPGDKKTRRFNDRTDNEGKELAFQKKTLGLSDLLPLEEFWEEIDTRTGFFQETKKDLVIFKKDLQEILRETRAEELAIRKLIREKGCTPEHKMFLGLKLGQKMVPDLEEWDATSEEN